MEADTCRKFVEPKLQAAGWDTALILTARTSVHDLFVDFLNERLHGKPFNEIRLDLLTDTEIKWFADLFTRFGMWGDKAALSDASKYRVLMGECHGQIYGILIKLLESPQIRQRLTDLFAPLTNKHEYEDLLICIAWIDEIEVSARSIADRIPELPEDRKMNRHVKECAKEMNYVLYKCAELKRRVPNA